VRDTDLEGIYENHHDISNRGDIIYGSENTGRGVATEADRLLTGYLFDRKQHNWIRLIIHPGNQASRRVAEKSGYTFESLSRGAWFHRGRNHEVEVWALLRTTPRPHHGRYRAGMTRAAALDDPEYRAAVVDLLGVLGLGELTAFERLAADAEMAPTLGDKAALAAMAVAEFHHFERLRVRLGELGVDADEAMAPFREPLEAFHDHTAPADWLEGLVKAYVGDGFAADFYREVAAYLDDETRSLVLEVLADTGHADFAVDRVRAAIGADPRVGGRLALWGRRLVGEALSQAQRVAADRDSLSALIAGGVDRPGMDLAAIGLVFARLTENHAKRMDALGLTA